MVDIVWVGSPNFHVQNGITKTFITNHWMVGTLASTDAAFNSSRPASSTYGVGENAIHQYVNEKDYPFSDGNTYANQHTISIEHEGGWLLADGSRKNPSPAVLELSAQLHADISRRHGFGKLVKDVNVFGHSHWVSTMCPGTLDIDWIITRANQILDGATTQTAPTAPTYLAPLEDDMFKLYFRKDAPYAGSPSGVTYALGVLDPSWQTPGHNFWFEASAESRRDWRELFGFRDVDGNPQAQSISYDIWNARSNDPNRISDVSKYVPMVNAPAQITNVTAAPLSDIDIKRIVLALQAAIPAATVPVPVSELASAVAKATLDAQAQRLMS